MNISFLLLGRTAPLAQRRGIELHAAIRERFAKQAFDLRVDAAQFGRGAAFDRRPQGRVDSQRIGFAVLRHGQSLLIECTGVDDGLGVAFAAKDDHQVRDHCRAALVVEFDDLLFG